MMPVMAMLSSASGAVLEGTRWGEARCRWIWIQLAPPLVQLRFLSSTAPVSVQVKSESRMLPNGV